MVSNGFFPLTLVEKTREYDEVFSLLFQPESPVPFVPGQYVHLLAPNCPPGRENVRHLSIASIPEEGPLRFTLDLAPSSDYKKKLAALEVGGRAHLFKVKGEFVLGEPRPSRAVFLSGGLGITPARSLIRQIVQAQLPVEWRLAHVARGPFLFQSELEALGGIQVRIRRSELGGLTDRWTNEFPEARWYVSGSSRFVEGAAGLLKAQGVEESRLRIEDFE